LADLAGSGAAAGVAAARAAPIGEGDHFGVLQAIDAWRTWRIW